MSSLDQLSNAIPISVAIGVTVAEYERSLYVNLRIFAPYWPARLKSPGSIWGAPIPVLTNRKYLRTVDKKCALD